MIFGNHDSGTVSAERGVLLWPRDMPSIWYTTGLLDCGIAIAWSQSLRGLGMNCANSWYSPIWSFCSDDLDNWLITQIKIRSVSAHNYRCFVWDRCVCAARSGIVWRWEAIFALIKTILIELDYLLFKTLIVLFCLLVERWRMYHIL